MGYLNLSLFLNLNILFFKEPKESKDPKEPKESRELI